MRQAKEFARTNPLPSKRRMDLPLFFRGVLDTQRTEDPIFMRGAPGIALVGLGEADLGAACGHSDFHESRHGRAVEGIDPAIGDGRDGRKGSKAHRGRKAHRGPKACGRAPKARNERGVWGRERLHGGVCEASPHTYQESSPL